MFVNFVVISVLQIANKSPQNNSAFEKSIFISIESADRRLPSILICWPFESERENGIFLLKIFLKREQLEPGTTTELTANKITKLNFTNVRPKVRIRKISVAIKADVTEAE